MSHFSFVEIGRKVVEADNCFRHERSEQTDRFTSVNVATPLYLLSDVIIDNEDSHILRGDIGMILFEKVMRVVRDVDDVVNENNTVVNFLRQRYFWV